MIKISNSLKQAMRKFNGILNKEFYGFDRTTINLIEQAEGVQSYSLSLTEYEDIAKMVTKDKKEYIIFQDVASANEYAIALAVRMEDDPDTLTAMKRLNNTPVQHFTKRVFLSGAEYVLSFDQTHKLNLPNGMIAYRTL